MATALDHLSSQSAELPAFLKLRITPAGLQTAADKSTETSSDTQPGNSDDVALVPLTRPAVSSSSPALLVPPLNFQNVTFGISRSGHPNERNYEFLRRLRLKTIMYVATDDYRSKISSFAEEEGIKVLHFRVSVNKEPFGESE